MREVRGKKYDEWIIGEVYETGRRTVTETDIVNFAGLSGDYNQLHTDAVFATSTPYGGRIAHGALVFSITTGLVDHSGLIDGTVIGFLGASMSWSAPVKAGDTISVRITPINKKLTKNPGRGIVTLKLQVVNQNDKVTCEQEWTVMFTV